MKSIFFYILLFFSINVTLSQNVAVPILEGPVTDITETLNKSEITLLSQKLLDFEANKNGQIVILIISSTGNESTEEYGIRVAEKWKIGSEKYDDGIILLVAKNDRKVLVELGYGPEQDITDADAINIIELYIILKFKNGDFYGGINDGIDRITSIIMNDSKN